MQSVIKKLPHHLINLIKAGEVVESVAQILKELIENALDAGASKLTIQLHHLGLEKIIIEDNGHGIRYLDLPLALERHTTSKINEFADIYRLNTFGFRGEALASIASVSNITIRSTYANETFGGEIACQFGELSSPSKFQNPGSVCGTTVIITNLFQNTPVRFKFLKSQASEKNKIQRVISSFLLIHPNLSLNLTFNDTNHFYPATGSHLERIKQLYPSAIIRENLTDQFKSQIYRLLLFEFPKKSFTGKKNFVFINKRLIEDKSWYGFMQHQLIKAGLENDNFLLNISLPQEEVDANVHPHKTQVRVEDLHMVQGPIVKMIPKKKPAIRLDSGKEVIPAKSTAKSFDLPNSLSLYTDGATAPIYLIDRNQLFAYLISKNKQLISPQPILIAFEVEVRFCKSMCIDQLTDILRDNGINFTSFNEKFEDQISIIVQSIPQFLYPFNYQSIIKSYIYFLVNSNQITVPSLIDYLKAEDYPGAIISIDPFIDEIPSFIVKFQLAPLNEAFYNELCSTP